MRTHTTPVHGSVSAALVLGVSVSAGFATADRYYEFFPTNYTSGAAGPAEGYLILPDSFGPGSTPQVSDIVDFRLGHTFDAQTTIVFDTTQGDTFQNAFGTLTVSDDSMGIDSGSFNMIDAETGARLRLVFNAAVQGLGDVNDNYVVDSVSNQSNGAYGGAFGGFVFIPEPATLGVLAAPALALTTRRRR